MSYSNYQQYQPDSIDQASKLIDFVDKISSRNNQQQSFTGLQNQPSAFNVGQFQNANLQDLARQQAYYGMPQSQPTSNIEVRLNQEIDRNQQLNYLANSLLNGIEDLRKETKEAYKLIDLLFVFFQINPILNYEIECLNEVLNSAKIFVDIAEIRTWELQKTDEVLNLLCENFINPDFLIYYAFKQWKQHIEPDNQGALSLIADEWVNLLDVYEQKYRDKYRRPSPLSVAISQQPQQQMQQPQQQMQQMPQMPLPPIPTNNGSGEQNYADYIRNKIQYMKNSNGDLAMQLQREHTMQRQNQGIY